VTIHERRGSGTWYYWVIVIVVVVVAVVGIALGYGPM
jgi:hypothetical protein